MVELRDYQLDMINKTRHLFKLGHKKILNVMPTGAGKTATLAHMIHSSVKKGKSSLFIVHRRELILQSMRAFEKEGISYGVISNGFDPNYSSPVQIASIQSLSRRIDKLKYKPDLVVFDECQHLAANNWDKTSSHFSNSYQIGLTATPCRLDGRGLSKYFDEMVIGPSTRWLIENGFLSKYKLFSSPVPADLSGIRTRMGDYAKEDLAQAMDRPKFIGNAVDEYKRRCLGKRAVVFCVNVEHSKHVESEFNHAGIKCEHVDGSDDTSYRSGAIERFKNGETKVLTNCDLFGEGFDLPSIECVILLRPTKSLSLYLQQIGRGLRTSEGKETAIILDHVRNYEMHGLPDDDRIWSLENGVIKSNKQEVGVKTCPRCLAAMRQTKSVCENCGFVYIKKDNTFDFLNSSTQDVLQEVEQKNILKRKKAFEQSSALSKDQLTQLAIKRGYKHPHAWAHRVFQARQAKKLRG